MIESEMGKLIPGSEPIRVTRTTPRLEVIGLRHQQRIRRVKVDNTQLELKLRKDLTYLTRKEKYAAKRHVQQYHDVEEELSQIKEIDESHVTLLPHHQFRLEEYQRRRHQRELQQIESDKRSLKRQRSGLYINTSKMKPRLEQLASSDEEILNNTVTVQQLNKLRGDIVSKRDNRLHFNQAIYSEAKAINKMAAKIQLVSRCSKRRGHVNSTTILPEITRGYSEINVKDTSNPNIVSRHSLERMEFNTKQVLPEIKENTSKPIIENEPATAVEKLKEEENEVTEQQTELQGKHVTFNNSIEQVQ